MALIFLFLKMLFMGKTLRRAGKTPDPHRCFHP
jgi:hypothetical protein